MGSRIHGIQERNDRERLERPLGTDTGPIDFFLVTEGRKPGTQAKRPVHGYCGEVVELTCTDVAQNIVLGTCFTQKVIEASDAL